jgi:hypothetical protein
MTRENALKKMTAHPAPPEGVERAELPDDPVAALDVERLAGDFPFRRLAMRDEVPRAADPTRCRLSR